MENCLELLINLSKLSVRLLHTIFPRKRIKMFKIDKETNLNLPLLILLGLYIYKTSPLRIVGVVAPSVLVIVIHFGRACTSADGAFNWTAA